MTNYEIILATIALAAEEHGDAAEEAVEYLVGLAQRHEPPCGVLGRNGACVKPPDHGGDHFYRS